MFISRNENDYDVLKLLQIVKQFFVLFTEHNWQNNLKSPHWNESQFAGPLNRHNTNYRYAICKKGENNVTVIWIPPQNVSDIAR